MMYNNVNGNRKGTFSRILCRKAVDQDHDDYRMKGYLGNGVEGFPTELYKESTSSLTTDESSAHAPSHSVEQRQRSYNSSTSAHKAIAISYSKSSDSGVGSEKKTIPRAGGISGGNTDLNKTGLRLNKVSSSELPLTPPNVKKMTVNNKAVPVPPPSREASEFTVSPSSVQHDVSRSTSLKPGTRSNITIKKELDWMLTSRVCLSLLETWPSIIGYKPSPAQIVQSSLERNISFHLSRIPQKAIASTGKDDDGSAAQSSTVDLDQELSYSDFDSVQECIIDSLRQGQWDSARMIYKAWLSHGSIQSNTSSTRAQLLAHCSILCLAQGNTKEGLQHACDSHELHTQGTRPRQAAVALMQVGTANFARQQLSSTLKVWRQGLQQACSLLGYQHPHVALLLNNLGVWHTNAGNIKSAQESFTESITLQKKLLKQTQPQYLSHSLLQTATTMINLALVTKSKAKSHAMWQDVLSVLESIEGDTSAIVNVVAEIVKGSVVPSDKVPNPDNTHVVVTQSLLSSRSSNSSLGMTERSMTGKTGKTSSTVSRDSSTQSKNMHTRNVSAISTSENSAVTLKSAPSKNSQQQWENDENTENGIAMDRQTSYTEEEDIIKTTSLLSCDSSRNEVSAALFGNADGRPRVNHTLLNSDDNIDWILLGSISNEWDVEERIHMPIKLWMERHKHHFLNATDDAQFPMDVDGNHISDAELHLRSIHRQAWKYVAQDKILEALDLLASTLKSHQQNFGVSHHLVGSALHNLGLIHWYARDFESAHDSFEAAVMVRAKVLENGHPDTSSSILKLGEMQMALGNLAAARRSFWSVRDVYLKNSGSRHPLLAKLTNTIATLHYHFGDQITAHRSFEIAYEYQLRLHEKCTDPAEQSSMSLGLANMLVNIAYLYAKDGDVLEAINMYEQALERYHKCLDPKDEIIDVVKANIGFLANNNVSSWTRQAEGSDDASSVFTNENNWGCDVFGSSFR